MSPRVANGSHYQKQVESARELELPAAEAGDAKVSLLHDEHGILVGRFTLQRADAGRCYGELADVLNVSVGTYPS